MKAVKMKRLVSVLIIAFLAAISSIFAAEPLIYVIKVKAGIGPGTADFIRTSIEKSHKDKAQLLVIELNTPGGLLETTRDIVHDLLESPIPVAVYVYPSGSRAGSAGAFITLAANIAAMAPGTNIGAAHPVGIGGGSDTSVSADKAVNDAAAFIRSIAEKRQKNKDWAESAVRESASITEKEALDLNVIDFIAKSTEELIDSLDQLTVETSEGQKQIFTKGAKVIILEKDWKQSLLTFLSDPNIAYIFIMLAIYGIMFEFYNPGSVFPGVVGGISAIIAAYSLQLLPVNYAGLALIILAVILFIIEIKVVSYGLLTIGGIASLVLGSIMLIDSPLEFMNISWSVILTSVILTTLFFMLIVGLGIKAQSRKASGGKEGLIGADGIALTELIPGSIGKVKVMGEIWKAEPNIPIKKGGTITVTNITQLTLSVSPKSER